MQENNKIQNLNERYFWLMKLRKIYNVQLFELVYVRLNFRQMDLGVYFFYAYTGFTKSSFDGLVVK